MCPPMRVRWRHLANMIELIHPLAHSSPHPKRQIDRFSGFCAVHGRKCLYFTMGTPIHQNCPFPWGDLAPSYTWCLGPMQAQNPNCTSLGSAVFAQMNAACPYALQWFACFSLRIVTSSSGIWIPCNTWFLGPTRVLNPNGNSIASVVFVGLTVTDRQTNRVRYWVGNSSLIGRMYVRSTAMWRNKA